MNIAQAPAEKAGAFVRGADSQCVARKAGS